MSRKKKVITDPVDGTLIETDEDTGAADYPTEEGVEVVWTEKAEKEGVFSEHGQHRAGDVVKTTYAALFIERGHATEVSE